MTAGPWTVQHVDNGTDYGDAVTANDGTATLCWIDGATKADARLIAAAPALLEALREIDESLTHVLERVIESARGDPQLGTIGALFLVAKAQKARARAAIRLAEGGE